jgi:hypothetical protein
MRDKVLIGYGQGFWGDSILGPVRLVREGPLDYLTLDYLAEVTMSIMQKLKARDPSRGYATDFVALVDRVLPELVEREVKVVANAGGVNPLACKDAVLTGLAQIKGFRGPTPRLQDMQGRVQCDLEYLRNWSLWLDLKIMLLTVPKLFKTDKAY